MGWLVRLHYDRIRRLVIERRGALSAGLAIAVVVFTAVASGKPRTALVRGATWLDSYAILGRLFVLQCGRGRSPRWVRSLADAAFSIYLIHLFFVDGAQSVVRATSQSFVPVVIVVYWSAGVVGALAVIGLARALLGPRSRDVVVA